MAFAISLVAGVTSSESSSHQDLSSSPSIVTKAACGPVRGHKIANGTIFEFLGIPYAEAPVGQLRWQPPQPKKPWKEVFDAAQNGPSCWQKGKPGVGDMSEDCLHLHVWAPASKSSMLLPVMVYIHGGSLVEGSAVAIQSAFAGPSSLAGRTHHRTINVAMNYRLGTLGFLALHELASNDTRGQDVAGNYGLLDVIEALRWVQRNIKSFGGDPSRVTVYGQSSGGSLVFALMTSPNAFGLFANAISMSGSPKLNSTFREAADYWHQEVIAETPCKYLPPNTTALRDCLLAMEPGRLVEAMPYDWDPSDGWSSRVFWDSYRYAPLLVIDGHLLPSDYRTPHAKAGARLTPLASNVPLIIGVTREEIDFAPGDDVRNETLQNLSNFLGAAMANSSNPEHAPLSPELFSQLVLGSYGLPGNPIEGRISPPELIFSDIISDATMLCGTYMLADSWASYRDALSIKAPIYMYSVSQRPGNPFCALGAFSHLEHPYCPMYSFHAIDMFALFGWLPSSRTPGHKVLYNVTEGDKQWTQMLRSRLVDQFAYNGTVRSPWMPYTIVSGNSVSESRAKQQVSRHVIDFNVNDERVVLNFRHSQCSLFLDQKFYNTKVWIN